jgi:hypothetical protein
MRAGILSELAWATTTGIEGVGRPPSWERVVVAAGPVPSIWSLPQLERKPIGMMLLQPKNVDTAAGVFLPLTFILANDSEATIVTLLSSRFSQTIWTNRKVGTRWFLPPRRTCLPTGFTGEEEAKLLPLG